jgi:hypothetical protein
MKRCEPVSPSYRRIADESSKYASGLYREVTAEERAVLVRLIQRFLAEPEQSNKAQSTGLSHLSVFSKAMKNNTLTRITKQIAA